MGVHRVMPTWDMSGHAVLDVGCRDGLHLSLFDAAFKHGIDVDREAIEQGRRRYPGLDLRVAPAEALPYPDRSMDSVVSKVTLPLTNIPVALAEIRRVLKPGGRVLLTMHDWRLQWRFFWCAVKAGAWKRAIDHVYVGFATAMFVGFGWVPARPLYARGTRECWQTRGSIARELERAGLELVSIERTEHDFIVHARG